MEQPRRRLPVLETIVTITGLLLAVALYRQTQSDDAPLAESKRRGATVVEALERYHADHGAYPGTLQELTPAYVPAIQPPTWGTGEWRYRRFEQRVSGDSVARYFELAVAKDSSNYPLLYYDWGDRRWLLHN
jgi:hypothetical protein